MKVRQMKPLDIRPDLCTDSLIRKALSNPQLMALKRQVNELSEVKSEEAVTDRNRIPCLDRELKNPIEKKSEKKKDRPDTQTVVTIQMSELTSRSRLIAGSTAVVYRAKWKDQYVAVKKFFVGSFAPQDNDAYFKNEITVLSTLSHPNIVKVHGIVKSPPAIVMELLPTDLCEALNAKPDLLSVSYDIASALNYLHFNNILHRDIKLENILMDENGRAKLCDFGFAVTATGAGMYYSSEVCGTFGSVAPELWHAAFYHQVVPYSFKSDIYAYGVLVFEMITKHRYLEEKYENNALHIMTAVMHGEKDVLPAECHPDFSWLVYRCLNPAPERRPSAQELVKYLGLRLFGSKHSHSDTHESLACKSNYRFFSI